MNITQMTQTIIWVLAVVFGGLLLWYRQKLAIQSKVAEFIAEAENRYEKLSKSGGIKFEWVAWRIYSMIPAAIRPLVARERIDSMIQTTFDAMQQYAAQQSERMAERTEKEVGQNAE